MVEISASMVKELRERSGAAMMDCKKALVETSGDFDKAFEWLRQKGAAVATKKASRATSEGLVGARVSPDGKRGSIIEVNCETDFVARNPEFTELTQNLADLVGETKPANVDAFLSARAGGGTVQEQIIEKVTKIGENIQIRRLAHFELGSPHGVIGLYVHAVGGKMGALLELEASKEVPLAEIAPLARELSMHIVSAKPQFISREEISPAVIDNERRIEAGKADLAEKKPEIQEKIVQGRVDKILSERCLLDQPFIKDPSQTISQYLKGKGAAWGAELKPVRFALFILGEGTSAPEEGKNGSH